MTNPCGTVAIVLAMGEATGILPFSTPLQGRSESWVRVKLPGRKGPKGDSDHAWVYGNKSPLAAALACTLSCLHLL